MLGEYAGELVVQASVDTQVPVDRVELLVNGRVVYSGTAAGSSTHPVTVQSSSWIALRALGPRHRLVLNDTMTFAHTSPVYVTVGGLPIRVPDDVRFYREWVEKLITRTETNGRFATPERKSEVVSLFRKALSFYQQAERQK